MGRQERQDHQPEPWTQEGRYILDASGGTLASTRSPADARRIVAAINAVHGIPTDALESWSVNVIGEPAEALVAAAGDREPSSASEAFPDDRRASNRRLGERRAMRPQLRILGDPSPRDGEAKKETG